MWLLGQPWIVLAAGAAVLVVLFGVLQQTGQRWALYSLIAAGLIFAGLLAIERFVITPEEAIKATLQRIALAAQSNDADAVAGQISRRAPELQEQARTMLKPWKLEEVKVKQISQLTVKPDGRPPVGSAVVKVLAVGGDRLGTLEHQRAVRDFKVEFIEEDGQWRVRGFEDLGSDLPGQ